MTNRERMYKGLGFVEALIAILVTGIASIALMDIASKTLSTTIKNEVSDKMTQYAVEGSEMVQIIADREELENEDLFPNDPEYAGMCFLMNEDVENPEFLRDDSGVYIEFTYTSREEFKELGMLKRDEEFFRFFCRTTNIDQTGSVVVGKVIVGLVDRIMKTDDEGDFVYDSGGAVNVSDYEHFTIIKL